MIQETEGAKKIMELCRRAATKRGLVLQELSWGIVSMAPGTESYILTIITDTSITADIAFTRAEVIAFRSARSSVKTRQKVVRAIEGML